MHVLHAPRCVQHAPAAVAQAYKLLLHLRAQPYTICWKSLHTCLQLTVRCTALPAERKCTCGVGLAPGSLVRCTSKVRDGMISTYIINDCSSGFISHLSCLQHLSQRSLYTSSSRGEKRFGRARPPASGTPASRSAPLRNPPAPPLPQAPSPAGAPRPALPSRCQGSAIREAQGIRCIVYSNTPGDIRSLSGSATREAQGVRPQFHDITTSRGYRAPDSALHPGYAGYTLGAPRISNLSRLA